MDAGLAVAIAKEALWTVVLVCLPPLACALAVGLLVSVLQTVTSIQDSTLAFAPKALAVFLSIVVFGQWMLGVLTNFAVHLFTALPGLVRP